MSEPNNETEREQVTVSAIYYDTDGAKVRVVLSDGKELNMLTSVECAVGVEQLSSYTITGVIG